MKLIENGYWPKEEIYEQLDKFLDKEIDRKLFGLAINVGKTANEKNPNQEVKEQ